MRTVLIWVVTQRVVVIPYQREKFSSNQKQPLRLWTPEEETDKIPRNVDKKLQLLAA
jgi:hypothetical protein